MMMPMHIGQFPEGINNATVRKTPHTSLANPGLQRVARRQGSIRRHLTAPSCSSQGFVKISTSQKRRQWQVAAQMAQLEQPDLQDVPVKLTPKAPWWTPETVAVVTGANRGIGLEIATQLAATGLRTILTSRSIDKGLEALKNVKAASSSENVLFHQLDISDPESVAAFAKWIQAEVGEVTILVNNAALAYKGKTFGSKEAKITLGTNFFGTMQTCEALLPMMSTSGRIVNVCSAIGKLSNFRKESLRARFQDTGSRAELVELANKFLSDVESKRHVFEGWPNSMYGVSKTCEAAYTRILAKELASKGVMVNACCPGACATELSSFRGFKSAAEGADTPVWLALMPKDEFVTGGFFTERRRIGF